MNPVVRELVRGIFVLPSTFLGIFGSNKTRDGDRKLSGALRPLCMIAQKGDDGLNISTVADVRTQFLQTTELFGAADRTEVDRSTSLLRLEKGDEERSLNIRKYHSRGRQPTTLLVFFHGGGWVIGDLETHDKFCQLISSSLACDVVAVDYPMSPEVNIEDSCAWAHVALKSIMGHVEEYSATASKVLVAGDSAGAALALTGCAAQIEAGERVPDGIWAIYPPTTFSEDNESSQLFREGYILSEKLIGWFESQWGKSRAEIVDNPAIAPGAIKEETLKKLPKTLITVAGFDPLRDQGIEFGKKLDELGVECTVEEEPNMTHGFIVYDRIPDVRRATIRMVVVLRRFFERR